MVVVSVSHGHDDASCVTDDVKKRTPRISRRRNAPYIAPRFERDEAEAETTYVFSFAAYILYPSSPIVLFVAFERKNNAGVDDEVDEATIGNAQFEHTLDVRCVDRTLAAYVSDSDAFEWSTM